jgi:hypothetical protein
MPFDWKALIDLAEFLQGQAEAAANPEAFYRSAVGRAYFGAFGHAFTYASTLLQFRGKAGPEEHGRLRDHLRKRRRKNASDRLGQLRQWRNDADYLSELPWADVPATVRWAILQAKEVVAILAPPAS